ncbi:kinase [Halioxenophilus sp. WMMB6]|uniref:kinase n=1 Tax=Halioxenophilus sp. WMMB6 TaxID=3073815 RepID=UPI00295E60AC|nr:kinase [Halioxenophilus sp. WMMB6]
MQTAVYNHIEDVLNRFLAEQKLPAAYGTIALTWFWPVLEKIVNFQAAERRPIVVGINGCQGSGKSTLAALAVDIFTNIHNKTAVAISIDDFYLTIAERESLAQTVHPLLLTRGVPGTHDMALANNTLAELMAGKSPVKIPRFNKAIDDRAAPEEWVAHDAPVDIIILEGWCMGSVAQTEGELETPVNELEEFEDRSGIWRKYVNEQLATSYKSFFDLVDMWIMLKAPSFDCVYRWRLEQEEKLKLSLQGLKSGRADYRVMSPQQIKRFIQYYQRVTEHTLQALPGKVEFLYEMDGDRNILTLHERL